MKTFINLKILAQFSGLGGIVGIGGEIAPCPPWISAWLFATLLLQHTSPSQYSGFNFSHYDLPFPTRYCIPYVRSGLYQLVIRVKGISCVRAWPRYALHDSFLSIGVDTTLPKKSSFVSLAHWPRWLFLLSRHRKAFLLLLIRSLL